MESSAMNFNERARIEIDLDAIEYNYRTIKDRIPEGTKVCCVVKADAYGHGAVRVARLLSEIGVDFFAVSNLDEALLLRKGGIPDKILILSYTPPNRAKELSEFGISQCVYSKEYADALAAKAYEEGIKIAAHIKIDTGMGRLGFVFRHSPDESLEQIVAACSHSCFDLEGIFTHFPCADEDTLGKTKEQFDRFIEVVNKLEGCGFHFKIRHCANSATSLRFPEYSLDMVRLGIALYGALPSENMQVEFIPRSTFTLKTVISNIKTVKAGDTIGYGASYAATKGTRIATIPIGYADGILRECATNGAELLMNGVPCKIVGRICMDKMMLDVDGAGDLRVGDEVTVFGGKDGIYLLEMARYCKTIPYEMLCMPAARIPRIYFKNGIAQ
jgi:alanine racemase